MLPVYLGAAMIRIDFTEQDIKKIKRLRNDDPHPRVRKRMDVLWLKSQGLAHQEICRLTGISGNTLRKYLRMFQSGGVEKLAEMNFYAPTSELEQHRCRLEVYFRKHPPATVNEAMVKIEELTGIKRSPSAVGRFLNSLGMRPRKVGAIPSKADPEEQENFRVNELEPRLEEAKEGKRAIFLSMLLISYSGLFSVFCGHLRASSYRPPPGEDVSTFSAR
jgi:transposase